MQTVADALRDPGTWWLLAVLVVVLALKWRLLNAPWQEILVQGVGFGGFIVGMRAVAMAEPMLIVPVAIATAGIALALWSVRPHATVRSAEGRDI